MNVEQIIRHLNETANKDNSWYGETRYTCYRIARYLQMTDVERKVVNDKQIAADRLHDALVTECAVR